MKNKKLYIIILAIILIIISLFFSKKAQSVFPKYLRVDNDKTINIPINHLFTGAKNIKDKTHNYDECLEKTNTKVTSCISFCPGFDTEGKYCPPKNASAYTTLQEGKTYNDIIVTDHSYYFDYALRRLFGFTQYKSSEALASNTSSFGIGRVIAFLHPKNIKSSSKVNTCNGTIKIEKALLGYAKTTNSNGSIAVHTNMPAIYFYVSRNVYPIDKTQKCINFGLPMDIVEPNVSSVKKYLPANFDAKNFRYYFLDIKEYPE